MGAELLFEVRVGLNIVFIIVEKLFRRRQLPYVLRSFHVIIFLVRTHLVVVREFSNRLDVVTIGGISSYLSVASPILKYSEII